MIKEVWSIDLSHSIKKAKANEGIDVVCAHCGVVAARLEAPEKHGMYAKDHEYKRTPPENLPEVNHGQDIICAHCGNVAARLRPIKDGMYT